MDLTNNPPARRFPLWPIAVVCCGATATLHATFEQPAGLIALVPVWAGWLQASVIADWVVRDAVSRKLRTPYDFGSAVFFIWPIFVIGYFLRTRGWRGFGPLAFVLLLYVMGVVLGAIPAILFAFSQ